MESRTADEKKVLLLMSSAKLVNCEKIIGASVEQQSRLKRQIPLFSRDKTLCSPANSNQNCKTTSLKIASCSCLVRGNLVTPIGTCFRSHFCEDVGSRANDHFRDKKQCSRQLQCEVPCAESVIDSSLSSLSSPREGGSIGGRGLGGGEGTGDISTTLPCTALPHGASL